MLAEAFKRTEATGSYQYVMRMSLSPSASGLSLAVPISVDGEYVSPGNFRSTINTTLRNVEVVTQEIRATNDKFETDPDTGLWFESNTASTPAGEAIDFVTLDPSLLTDVEVGPIRDLNGVDVYEVSALAPAGLIGNSPGTLDLIYWLGLPDLVIRQVVVSGIISWPQVDVLLDPSAGGVSPISVIMQLNGFGRLFDIQAPAASASIIDTRNFEVVTANGFPISAAKGAHAASKLSDGRVVIAGGESATGATSVSEIYDPDTGIWSSGPNMANPRTFPRAVTLQDGRILMTLGATSDGPLASNELYNPSTDEWSDAGDVEEPRSFHTATLLSDGRVLVVGGGDSTRVVNSVDIFDPTTDTWSAAAPTITARAVHSATLLSDGHVLVVGGLNADDLTLISSEIYDPVANTWTETAARLQASAFHAAVLLPDGRVLISGGITDDAIAVRTSEIYDPTSHAWTETGSTNDNHIGPGIVPLDTGEVILISGGDLARTNPTVEQWSPNTNKWTVLGLVATPRGLHTTTILDSGKVLIAGGGDSRGPVNSTEILDPKEL